MLKLKRKHKNTQEAAATTMTVQTQTLVSTSAIPINPHTLSQVPINRQVKNTTGALLSKITKKFERWKPHIVKNPQTTFSRKITNGNTTNTK